MTERIPTRPAKRLTKGEMINYLASRLSVLEPKKPAAG